MTDDITNRQLLDAMTDQLSVIIDNMVTKKDLDERLKAFASKDDLKAFATKEDLRDELRSTRIKLERKIDGNQKANVQHHLETRKAIGSLNGDLTKLREGLAQASGLA